MTQQINFNENNVKDFIRLYNKANREEAETFFFEDGEFLTKYAYYLIQHLVDNLKIVKGKFNDKRHFLIKNI